MKSKCFSFLLCVLMLFSFLPANAEDPSLYSFQNGGVDIPGYDYDQDYFYPTPYTNLLRVDENKDGVITPETETFDPIHTVLNMVDLSLVEKGGTGHYASIPVYCFDFSAFVYPGVYYMKKDLEEFSPDSVKNHKLRAILHHSFPYVTDMAELQSNVNAWLEKTDGPGYTPVKELTAAEAIMVTQTAVWSQTNLLEVENHWNGIKEDIFYYFKENNCIYYEGYADQTPGDHSAQNCISLYRYLQALAPEGPDSVKDYAFSRASAVLTPDEAGTCTAEITVQLTETPDADTDATLTATCGSLISAPIPLSEGVNTYTLTLTRVPADHPQIRVKANGVQLVGDAFFFESEESPREGQCMGGYTAVPYEINIDSAVETAMTLPSTGDNAPLALLTAASLLSIACMMLIYRKRA